MPGLKQLLIDLGNDTELQQEYENNPKAVAARYQLNDEETQAMLKKDLEKVKSLSGIDSLKSNGHIQAHDYR